MFTKADPLITQTTNEYRVFFANAAQLLTTWAPYLLGAFIFFLGILFLYISLAKRSRKQQLFLNNLRKSSNTVARVAIEIIGIYVVLFYIGYSVASGR